MMRIWLVALGLWMLFPMAGGAQTVSGPLELTSSLGRKLYGLADDQNVADARSKLAADPKNLDLILALSKAQAARRQYREAVATSDVGLALAPSNGALLAERGHRELGLREFAAARRDLERAAELTPTDQEVVYNLALTHYFVGEFADAARLFDKARALAKDDDGLISSSNWLYASLRRAGKDADAELVLTRITPEVKNKDPHEAHYLNLLHFYQGKASADTVLPAPPTQADDFEAELAFDTIGYAIGNWNLYHHESKRAKELFSKVVEGQAWNSWGFIGSEMELKRAK
jgi:tetratricopeptide (TPR) repeat protein